MATYHVAFSIRGGLHWSDQEWQENVNIFTDEEGKPMTIAQAKEALMDELKKGFEVLPMTKCDNFDPEHGCQGHENEEDLNDGE